MTNIDVTWKFAILAHTMCMQIPFTWKNGNMWYSYGLLWIKSLDERYQIFINLPSAPLTWVRFKIQNNNQDEMCEQHSNRKLITSISSVQNLIAIGCWAIATSVTDTSLPSIWIHMRQSVCCMYDSLEISYDTQLWRIISLIFFHCFDSTTAPNLTFLKCIFVLFFHSQTIQFHNFKPFWCDIFGNGKLISLKFSQSVTPSDPLST